MHPATTIRPDRLDRTLVHLVPCVHVIGRLSVSDFNNDGDIHVPNCPHSYHTGPTGKQAIGRFLPSAIAQVSAHSLIL